MRVGITLPQFRPEVEASIGTAVAAEELGLDGIFVFDHVWAIGNPARPAQSCWPLLGGLAGATSRIHLGTLVARVSLLPNAVLAHNLESVHRMVGDRLIAGLGAGDRLSRPENEAVDVPFAPVEERLAALADACERTKALGIPTWIGGLSDRVAGLARAAAVPLNLWGVPPERCREVEAVEVTWGGVTPATVGGTADLLARLADAGVTWAVCAPSFRAQGEDVDPLPAVRIVAEAAETLR